ncbi:TPA: hypothetical protein ACTYZB_004892 [Klebsiella variicola]
MSKYEPQVGKMCQMIYTSADVPRWINCMPKALSAFGIALSVNIAEEGQKTIWFENFQIDRDVVFRPIVPESKQWTSKGVDDVYELVCLSNVTTAKPSFPLTVIFKNAGNEIFSMDAVDFLNAYSPVVEPVSCEIIESQDAPVLVSPEFEAVE